MAKESIFSVCGMCTVRCPIQVDVENDEVVYIQGNPYAPGLQGALCARGAAGLALLNDDERPQFPMIREGARGEGKWKRVSWDEALDYVSEKLKAVMDKHGGRSVLWSDRGGPFPDLHQAFMRGLGSPNYCNHDSACARNVQHAAQSLFGFGRKGVIYDYKNAKHIVLQTRNLFEAINVKEVNDTLDALGNGCKLTVIDIRANISASKATRFFMIRPGTDYAFNLGVIHELLTKRLYDVEYASRFIQDLDALKAFVAPYSPEWAAEETGVSAKDLRAFVQELAQASPSVLWHPGWMNARYSDSFYMSRTIYIINSLLGAIGAKGGLPMAATPKDVGRKGLKKLADLFPKPEEKRADGVGWKHPQFDAGPGLLHLAFKAIETGEPYPIRAYICHRHDPLMAYPDPEALKKVFDKLDLLVSTTFSWSDTAWYADVVLPLSTYLERESILAGKNGLKPSFFIRNRAVQPRYESKAEWEILCGLAKRLGMDKLAFDSIEDIWAYQLEGTGVTLEDFKAKGSVSLADKPKYFTPDEFVFKTPSGKIELINQKWESQGLPSLKPYVSPDRPGDGRFRITFGRCGVHTQGHTVNNSLLSKQMPENILWMNEAVATKMGIAQGDLVEVSANGYSGRIKAFVTEFIHPEAVFMVHGFGHTLPVESRARGKGVADHMLMPGGIEKWDPAGGAIAMQEHFISVRKI
ncbi:MAG TPA: thiosulfate reductase [Desulfonatronum sp.]|nr:thiosulfate reductase [Desulfonatronum sp.]